MSLDSLIKQKINEVPECVAVGYVDMSTGMILAVKTVDSHPQEIIDVLAAATADMFQGPSVVSIEKMWRKSRGMPTEGPHLFKEVIVLSDNMLHVFVRTKKYPDHAAVFVARKSANVGMALMKARLVTDALAAEI